MTGAPGPRDPALLLKAIPPRVARDLLERERLACRALMGPLDN